MAKVRARAGVLVRLSPSDLQTAGAVAAELGVPLDRLFSVCALAVAAHPGRDSRQLGPPPERFAAAELLHLSFSPSEMEMLERAAGAASFLGPAGSVALNVSQFVSAATLHLVRQHGAGDRAQTPLRDLFPAQARRAGAGVAIRPEGAKPSLPPARAPAAAKAPRPMTPPPTAISRGDLRLAIGIGVAMLVSLIGAIVYFGGPASRTQSTPPVRPAVGPVASAAPPPKHGPVVAPAPLELPPAPEFSPKEVAQMRAELKALTSQFHDRNAASKRIDTLLRNVYGRPRVPPEAALAPATRAPPKLLSLAPGDRQFDAEILTACDAVAQVYPVPPALVKAIIRRESSFNPKAVSVVGAIGLMQVMPFNADRVGLAERDLWDPAKNILAGTRLIAVLLRLYHGDVISSLVAYNAKPRDLFASIPRNSETPGYVAAVLANYEAYAGEPLRNRLGSSAVVTSPTKETPSSPDHQD